jgi:hypothetical protein
MAVIAAAVGAALIWLVAVLAVGVKLQAPIGGPGSTELGDVLLPTVIATALVVSLAGWALLAVLERVLSRGRTVWTVIAAVVLLLSIGAPLGGAGLTTGSRITLLLLHLTVGGVLLTLLPRTSPAR